MHYRSKYTSSDKLWFHSSISFERCFESRMSPGLSLRWADTLTTSPHFEVEIASSHQSVPDSLSINNIEKKRNILAISLGCNLSFWLKPPARHAFPAFLLWAEGFSPSSVPAVHIDSRQFDAVHSATVWTLISASLGYIVCQKIGRAIFLDRGMNPRRFLCGLSR